MGQCLEAAGKIGLDVAAVATGGASEGLEIAGEEAVEVAAEDATEDGADAAAASCGGMSFTPSTKVLLASGLAVPIATLKPGDKVLATNVKTGKTQAEPVSAVLLHHDTNLYNLKIRTGHRRAVIHTTRNHRFWDLTRDSWVKAGKLKHGDHLRTSSGASATVVSGRAPADTTGWMWDISVPGGNDHDFYIGTAVAAVLVHNCGGTYSLQDDDGNIVRTGRTSNLEAREAQHANDSVLGQFRFVVDQQTDNYAEQRGLEQMLYDANPQAQAVNGGFNYIRGIALSNPNIGLYMAAAMSYLGGG